MLNKPNFLFRILTKYSSWIFFDIPKTMLGCLLSVYTVHSIYIFLQFTTYVCTLYNVQLNNCTLVHSTNTVVYAVDSFFLQITTCVHWCNVQFYNYICTQFTEQFYNYIYAQQYTVQGTGVTNSKFWYEVRKKICQVLDEERTKVYILKSNLFSNLMIFMFYFYIISGFADQR